MKEGVTSIVFTILGDVMNANTFYYDLSVYVSYGYPSHGEPIPR
jgi:hypothetical protein